jgi:hypothetical protein
MNNDAGRRQEVQSNRHLCRLLASRITQILDIVQSQTAEFEEDSIPASIANPVHQFTRSGGVLNL